MNSQQEIPDIVKGHELWLEPTHLHFHSNAEVEIRALWGHMMQRDGMGRPENWKAYVIGPDGAQRELTPEYGEGLFHVFYFPAGAEGLYTVVVENDAGIYNILADGRWEQGPKRDYPEAQNSSYYYQWAKLTVPVGHHVHGAGTALGKGLDIVPEEFKEYRLGDRVNIKVNYDGQPLADTEVKATYHLYDGKEYPIILKTDGSGEVSFNFNQKGHWMFYVSHRDDSRRKEGEYDGMQLASTLVIPGVR